jgi:hypothetical protein
MYQSKMEEHTDEITLWFFQKVRGDKSAPQRMASAVVGLVASTPDSTCQPYKPTFMAIKTAVIHHRTSSLRLLAEDYIRHDMLLLYINNA